MNMNITRHDKAQIACKLLGGAITIGTLLFKYYLDKKSNLF